MNRLQEMKGYSKREDLSRMKAKIIKVRDARETRLFVATLLGGETRLEKGLLEVGGEGGLRVLLMDLTSKIATADAISWCHRDKGSNPRYAALHLQIEREWHKYKSGDEVLLPDLG